MKTTNLLLFCAEAGFMILVGEMRETRRGLGIAAFLIWLFRGDQLLVAPQGDFLDVEKVTKDTHRERVFPLKGLSRWAAVATFYLNEPSSATTEVGLRSPFWNPLRMVQCLTLPTDFFEKINLTQKRRLIAVALPSLGGIQRGTAHGSSLAVQGWGFKRGGENAIPAPFVILCILSVHTESMPTE